MAEIMDMAHFFSSAEVVADFKASTHNHTIRITKPTATRKRMKSLLSLTYSSSLVSLVSTETELVILWGIIEIKRGHSPIISV